MSGWIDEVEKTWENTRDREVKVASRSQRDKLRALRDEFGFVKPEPQSLLCQACLKALVGPGLEFCKNCDEE